MDLNTFMQALALFQTHAWMPLAILLIGYLTTTFSDVSKVPVNVPDRWKPVLVLGLSQAYAILMLVNGNLSSWKTALAQGLFTAFITMGLFDVVMKAIFNGNLPQWAHFLVFFDSKLVDLKAGGAKIVAPLFGSKKAVLKAA